MAFDMIMLADDHIGMVLVPRIGNRSIVALASMIPSTRAVLPMVGTNGHHGRSQRSLPNSAGGTSYSHGYLDNI